MQNADRVVVGVAELLVDGQRIRLEEFLALEAEERLRQVAHVADRGHDRVGGAGLLFDHDARKRDGVAAQKLRLAQVEHVPRVREGCLRRHIEHGGLVREGAGDHVVGDVERRQIVVVRAEERVAEGRLEAIALARDPAEDRALEPRVVEARIRRLADGVVPRLAQRRHERLVRVRRRPDDDVVVVQQPEAHRRAQPATRLRGGADCVAQPLGRAGERRAGGEPQPEDGQ